MRQRAEKAEKGEENTIVALLTEQVSCVWCVLYGFCFFEYLRSDCMDFVLCFWECETKGRGGR